MLSQDKAARSRRARPKGGSTKKIKFAKLAPPLFGSLMNQELSINIFSSAGHTLSGIEGDKLRRAPCVTFKIIARDVLTFPS